MHSDSAGNVPYANKYRVDTTVIMFKNSHFPLGTILSIIDYNGIRPLYTKSILKILISLPIGFNSISLAIKHQESYNRNSSIPLRCLPQINIPYVSRPTT